MSQDSPEQDLYWHEYAAHDTWVLSGVWIGGCGLSGAVGVPLFTGNHAFLRNSCSPQESMLSSGVHAFLVLFGNFLGCGAGSPSVLKSLLAAESAAGACACWHALFTKGTLADSARRKAIVKTFSPLIILIYS
eukprot:348886-Pelagomonas_calceolata.AAC.4